LQVREFFLHFVLSAKSDTRTAQDERVPNPKKKKKKKRMISGSVSQEKSAGQKPNIKK